MVKRLREIAPGPLLIVCSFLVLIIASVTGLENVPEYHQKLVLIGGEWQQTSDHTNGGYGSLERFFLVTASAVGAYISYWTVIRVVL